MSKKNGNLGWRCGSSVEHLPSNHKALDSNPSTAEKMVI
jgi:hypothetical protein